MSGMVPDNSICGLLPIHHSKLSMLALISNISLAITNHWHVDTDVAVVLFRKRVQYSFNIDSMDPRISPFIITEASTRHNADLYQ